MEINLNQESIEDVTQTQEDVIMIDEEEMSPDDKIAYWKTLHQKIYLSVYDEQEFVWRKLKRREYTEIMSDTTDEKIDDVVEHRQYLTICTCLLSPSNESIGLINEILEEYPGLLTSLSAEILKKSGFSKPLTIEI